MKLSNLFFVALAAYDDLFGSWGNIAKNVLSSALKLLVIPICLAVAGVFLVIEIVTCVTLRKNGQGEDIKDHLLRIVMIVAIIILLSSFYAWAPFIGL